MWRPGCIALPTSRAVGTTAWSCPSQSSRTVPPVSIAASALDRLRSPPRCPPGLGGLEVAPAFSLPLSIVLPGHVRAGPRKPSGPPRNSIGTRSIGLAETPSSVCEPSVDDPPSLPEGPPSGRDLGADPRGGPARHACSLRALQSGQAARRVFGAALGSPDVAMNVHAVEVERSSARPLMSGSHALFSVGGFLGSAVIAAILSFGVAAFPGAVLCASLMVIALGTAWPRLLVAKPAGGPDDVVPLLVRPRGLVFGLAGLAAVLFLVEGTMLDWGALLVTGKGLLARDRAGLGTPSSRWR